MLLWKEHYKQLLETGLCLSQVCKSTEDEVFSSAITQEDLSWGFHSLELIFTRSFNNHSLSIFYLLLLFLSPQTSRRDRQVSCDYRTAWEARTEVKRTAEQQLDFFSSFNCMYFNLTSQYGLISFLHQHEAADETTQCISFQNETHDTAKQWVILRGHEISIPVL